MKISWKEFLGDYSWHSSKFIGSDGWRYKFIIGKSLSADRYTLTLLKYRCSSFTWKELTSCPTLKDCKKAARESEKQLKGKQKLAA